MKRIKKQKKYPFGQAKPSKSTIVQVNRYISEGNPNTQQKIEETIGTPPTPGIFRREE